MKVTSKCFSSLWALVIAMLVPLVLLQSGPAGATASNEEACSDAPIIASIPFQVNVDTTSAVTITSTNSTCVDIGTRGVWFKYTPTDDIIVETVLTDKEFQARLVVHQGSCDSMTCIDSTTGYQNVTMKLSFPMYAGDEYYFLVVGRHDDDAGTATFSITSPGSVSNDVCSAATNVPSIPTSLYVDTTAAVPYFSDSSCSVQSDRRGVWYQYTPTFDSIVELNVTNQDFDVQIAVFEGSCDSLSCIVDVYEIAHTEREFQFPTYTGVTYYILVAGGNAYAYGTAQVSLTSVGNVANDECTGAVTVSSLPYEVEFQTTSAVPYMNSTICGDIFDTDRVLWYKYTPTEDHLMQLSVSDSRTSFPEFSVLSGANCSAITTCMIHVYDRDTSVSNPNSDTVQLVVHAGVTYYILIYGKYWWEQYGPNTLSIRTLGVPGGNDVCTSATNVESLPYQTTFNTASMVAGFSFFDEACDIGDYTKGVWYQYTATEDSRVSVRVYDQSFLFLKTAVFRGPCASLLCLEVNGAYDDFLDVTLQFNAYTGVTYYIFVVGEGPEDIGQATISIESSGEVTVSGGGVIFANVQKSTVVMIVSIIVILGIQLVFDRLAL